MKICAVCGKKFESPYPIAKYCSNNCRKEGYKKYSREYMRKYWKENPEQYKKLKEGMRKFKGNIRIGRPSEFNTIGVWRNGRGFFEKLTREIQDKIIELAKEQQSRPIHKKNSKCFICESTTNLRIHHISYNPEKIVTLCGSCHGFIHTLAKRPFEIIEISGKRFVLYKRKRRKKENGNKKTN